MSPSSSFPTPTPTASCSGSGPTPPGSAGPAVRALPAYGRGHLGESMAYWGRSDGSTYYLSGYVGGAQALAKLGDQLGGYDRLDCAIRRYVRDGAYTVSRPSDFLAAVQAQTGTGPRPILAALGVG